MNETLIQTIFYIGIFLILLGGICAFILFFLKLPVGTQKKKIKEWLIMLVSEIEKAYGSGTGQLKLRAAYDQFIQTFPFASLFISFDKFSKWIDEALDSMKHLIETNIQIDEYITERSIDDLEPDWYLCNSNNTMKIVSKNQK